MIETHSGNLPSRPDYFRIPTSIGPDGTRQFGKLEPVYKANKDELEASKELEALHRDMDQVTGKTAVAVFQEMQTYEAYPTDTPKDILKPQKDKNDNLAAEVMVRELNALPRRIHMITGEGGKDIKNGHEIDVVEGNFGLGGKEHDGVNDPLEGTTFSTMKLDGISSAIAIVEPGGIISVPEDCEYMQKIFAPYVGGQSLDDRADIAVVKVMHGLRIDLGQLRVTVLNRPRNQKIIDDLRRFQEGGLDLNLIEGGDLLPSVMSSDERDQSGKFNMVIGIGGGPEGLIAAAAAKATGKTFVEARWWPKDPETREGYTQKLTLNDLVPGRANGIVVELAHITPDSLYTLQKGVRQRQNGHIENLVDFTSVDLSGITHTTRSFAS